MAPSQTSTASDAVMPESPLPAEGRASMEARAELEAQELDAELDPSEQLVDVFVGRAPSSNPSNKTADDLPEAGRDGAPDENEANAVHLGYADDSADRNGNPAEDAGDAGEPGDGAVGADLPEAADTGDTPNQPQEEAAAEPRQAATRASEGSRRTKRTQTLQQKTAVAREAAAVTAAASAAALAAAAVSSGTATATVPTMPLASGLAGGGYPFAGLGPNGGALMGPLVSLALPVGRRAVRIAPMGVLPLPAASAGTGPLVSSVAELAVGPVMGGGDTGRGEVVEGAGGRIGVMGKGKRRGSGAGGVVAVEGLSAEERTKQKRMLRNRESAARSRDKRKVRNIMLEKSVAEHRAKRKVIEGCLKELHEVVGEMREVLKKHKIELPG